MKNKILSKAYGGVIVARHKLNGLGLPRQWKVLMTLVFLFTFSIGNVWAADLEETSLVSSNFASATVRAYVGNVACAITGDACPAPFTELYMAKSSNCDVAVNSATGGGSRKVSGKLQAYLNNTSKKWSWVRSSNLATTAPEVLHIKAVMLFDKTLAGSAGNTMCIAVGNGFEDGTQAYPAATNVVAGFSFNGGNTKINKYNAYAISISGSKEFSNNTEFTLDWYINNSASKISYTDPNGTSHDLAAGCFDIWVDKVLFCDAVDKTTNGVSGTTMQNLYIGSNGSSTKKHEFVLSSINIYSLSAASACTAPAAPTISGTASYTEGETITLTASHEGTNHSATTTYQWFKGATFATATSVQAAATGAAGYTFTKTAALSDDGSVYWCEAANSTCTSHNTTGFAITVAAAPAATYNATFANGGHGTAPTAATGVSSVTLTEITGVDGWKNTGWKADVATKNGSTSVPANTLIENGETITLLENTTFTAQWAQTYAVTYTVGAGSGTAPAAAQYAEGAKFNLPGQGSMTAPSGKVFDGWKANGTGDKLAAGAEYTMGAAAVQFVAQWKAVPQTIFHWRADAGTTTTDAANGTTTGGTVTLRSTTTDAWGTESVTYNASVAADMKATSTNEMKSGKNAVYLELALTSGTFQEDDTIYVTGYNTWGFSTSSSFTSWDVDSIVTGATAKGDVKTGYGIIKPGVNAAKIYVRRGIGSGSGIAAIKIIRPAERPISSTTITLSDVKVNNHSISSDSLAILTTAPAYALTLKDEFVTAPEIKFNEHKVITYADELLPATKVTDKVYTVTATVNGEGQWQAQQEVDGNTYTVKAPKQSSVKLAYYDGATKLGEETVGIGGHPAEYAAKQSKDFATFVAWYNNSDLAEEHKIANIAELVVNEATNVYGKWTPAYASSINIEQWVLDNGVSNSPFRAELTARHYKYATLNNLDSLNDDPSKDYRNYAYLGQKVNKTDSEISFLLKTGSTLKVRFGHLGSDINVVIGSADPVALTSAEYANDAPGDKKYTYTATEDVIVKFQCTGTSTSVFKQIMINEDIAAVTLPWRVTYDANGGTCATAEAIWSGAALILPDVTPADADHTFAGWYDEVSGGSLQGVAGASYTPTDNTTLHAQFAPVEYAVNYAAGDHGSGDMAAANVGWGTEYTAVANGFTPETGYIFAGWDVSGVDGVSSIAAGGSFTMPKNPVTLTALWEDNSKVAVIVDTNVKYESLADAVAAATNGQTIQLLQNNNVTAQVEVAGKAITLDLAGYKIEYTGTSTLPSGVILVHNGASLTIDDSSDPDAGSIVSGEKAYAAIALTKAGDDAANPATLVVNGGTLTGHYYGITGNGSRNNTDITINGGTITGTVGIAIYHPQVGTLTVNNGSLTGEDAAIEMRAGTLVINDGTFTATATVFSCNPNGSGSTTSGAAIAIAQHTTKKDISVTINGGTFNGVKALNESNPQVNDPAPQVTMAVTAGTFTGEVSTVDVHEFISGGTYDAPVASENCAPGYVPSAEVAPGVYTVVPKDGVEIIGVVTTGGTNKTVTGLYKGDASVDLDNSKKLADGKYIFVTLKEGYTFEENDVLIIDLAAKSDLGGGTKALEITTGIGNIDGAVWKSIAFDDYDGSDTISLEGIAPGQTSIGLKRSANQNAKVNGIKVLRPMKPMLTAITINERVGVIDEANKTVAVTIPYEADLAALTVVPTIAWNEAAAANSIVVNNGGAWVENPNTNTYKLTDKDGDYTVYTITLTRDVLKHTVSFNTHGGTAVASEEVVHGEYLAAAPAAPMKDENVFKFWSETEDGAEVDVTTVQINADKEFHAVWEAEPAGIKLFTDLGLNTTNFISAAKATDSVEINTVKYPYLVAFGSNRPSLAEAKQADLVMYSATTDATKIKFDLYNTNGSAKTAYVWLVEEGDDEATQLDAIEVAGTTRVKTAYYEFNGTKNRTVYLTSGAKADIKVLQAKVIESGSAIHQFGQAGYVVDFNKGRIAGVADGTVSFEGAAITMKSDYKVLNSTSLSPKTYIQFNNPVANTIVKIKRSGSNKYYVTNDLYNKGTEYSSDQEITLTATGTWYIGSVNPGSAAQITKIEFIAPKCAEPQFNALANSDLCEGEAFAALNGIATVGDAGTPIYQWYNADGDVEIEGATSATYTPTADGSYYVIATNQLAGYSDNAKKSETVTVKHFAAAEITTAPANVRKDAGVAATLTVVATGKDLHYTWKECATIDGTYTDVAGAADAASLNVTVPSGVKYYKVVVSSACGDAVEAIAKVEEWTELPQVHISATTEWDLTTCADAEIKLTSTTSPKKGEECLMANIEGVHLDANFNSQALVMSGEYIYRNVTDKPTCAEYMKFITDVEGVVTVTFAGNGSNRLIRVTGTNGVQYSTVSTGTGDTHTEKFFVTPGEVELMGMDEAKTQDKRYMRFFNITFTAEPNYTRPVTEGRYGTICLPNGGVMVGATLYEVAYYGQTSKKIFFDEILNGEMVAGVPYIFLPKEGASQLAVYYTDEANESAKNANGLHGFIGANADAEMNVPVGAYILNANQYREVVTLGTAKIKSNRSYIVLEDINPSEPALAPGRRRISMSVYSEQVATGIENTGFESEAPRKVLINGELFIIRGEKMYDAKGQLVK